MVTRKKEGIRKKTVGRDLGGEMSPLLARWRRCTRAESVTRRVLPSGVPASVRRAVTIA
jgi:hypothetical protein